MNIFKQTAALFVVTSLLFACSTAPNDAQMIDSARTALTAAEMLEELYGALPPCAGGGPKLCQKSEVTNDAHVAHVAAVDALNEYERAVNTSGFGSNAAVTALTVLRAAVNAYVKVTADLKTN